MRRFWSTSTTAQAVSAAGTNLQSTRKHGHAHDHGHDHGHSHSGGHGHSHGAIEANIQGRDLFACKVATAVGGATNVFFGVTKLCVGSSGGSVALMADGFHSVTDIAADIVSYFSISMSDKKLPRCRYPFGIGRLETTGAVVVAAILFFGGIGLLIQSFAACIRDLGVYLATSTGTLAAAATSLTGLAYKLGAPQNNSATHDEHDDHDHAHDHNAHASVVEAAHGHSHDGGAHGHSHFTLMEHDSATGKHVILWSMVALAASSVVVKELLYHWTRRVGKRAGSRVVVANAYHHRADAWSGGVALLGVLGTCVGIPGIDGLAGCIVSLSICRIGYSLFKGSILEFFDSQNIEELADIRAQLQQFHVTVRNGTVTAAAAEGCGDAKKNSTDEVNSTTPVANVDAQHIRFVNVFLMRHGHKYVLYVSFLAHQDVSVAQLQQATDVLTALARNSLPVEMTYTSLQLCQGETVSKAEYLNRDVSAAQAAAGATAEGPHDMADEQTCAARGERVNPSLETIIHQHLIFHGSLVSLAYNWEKREMYVSSDYCDDCLSDAESIAKMFYLTLVRAPPAE